MHIVASKVRKLARQTSRDGERRPICSPATTRRIAANIAKGRSCCARRKTAEPTSDGPRPPPQLEHKEPKLQHRRASPSYGDVLGPSRFNGALPPEWTPRTCARHFELPEMRRRLCLCKELNACRSKRTSAVMAARLSLPRYIATMLAQQVIALQTELHRPKPL